MTEVKGMDLSDPVNPPRIRRFFSCILLFLAGMLVGWVVWLFWSGIAGQVTTISLSLDDKTQAVLVERSFLNIDRNFAVRLGPAGVKPTGLETVFTSPDEGKPVG